MVRWHHHLDGHEFEQTRGVGDEQGGLASCSSWHRKALDMTEWLNWTDNKHTFNLTLNSEMLKAVPLRLRKTQECPLTNFIKHRMWNPSHCNQSGQQINGIHIGRKEIKLHYCRWWKHTQKILKMPQNYQNSLTNPTNFQDTKLIHRNLLQFYTLTTKKSEREFKEIIPLAIPSNKIKYLGINITKEIRDLYSENYKMLVKKLRTTHSVGKDTVFMDFKS